jgi:phytoene dehydrogenase-like protein
MRRKSEEHEIVILGSGLGGLIAGALLSRNNRKVLLLKERRYQPSFVREGYRFVPFSNFSERRLKHSLLQKITHTLNLPPVTGDREDGRKADRRFGKTKQELAFQVILPKARVDLFCQRSIFRREWKREFSKEADRIANLYKEMERIAPLMRRIKSEGGSWSAFPIRSSHWIKRWLPLKSLPRERMNEKLSTFSKEFREFIQLQLISWGNLYSDRFPFYLAAYLLLQDEGEEWISQIDLERMEKRILEIFVHSGGKIEEIEGVEKIERKWLGGFALSLKGETGVLRSRFLLFNCPLHHLSHLLGKKNRKLSRWREKIQPRYALVPLFLGIDEKVVPVGMRDLLVSILDLEKPYGGGNLLFLHLGPKGNGESAPEGKRALAVESLISMEQGDLGSLDEQLRGVMRHLEYLFPFLEHYVEFTDWSWAKEQFSCWSYPHFLYETNHDFNWGEGVVPVRLLRNLYFVGKENFPYLGLEGEFISGRLVGKQLLEKFKS